MGEGERFLDTLTRSFMQARDLVESDTQRRRAAERFESEQEAASLKNRMLEQELRIRTEDEGRRQEQADVEATKRGRETTTGAELMGTPFPEAEAPPGAGISDELAAAISPPGGLQEYGTAGPATSGIPEGYVPVEGQPGLFLDINFEQKEAERTRGREAEYVADQMEAAAKAADDAGDLEEGQRIRDAIPRAVLDVHQGRQPDTSAILEARERRTTPTYLQSERERLRSEERAEDERQREQDTIIERQLQSDAHRQLGELGDPAGRGEFVEGRDYERQLVNARASGRRQREAAAKPGLTLREAISVLRDDDSIWSPDTGYKIPLSQVMQRARDLVAQATDQSSLDNRTGVTQDEYNAIIEDEGEEYAAANFVVVPEG